VTVERATRVVRVDAARVRELLSRPLELPDWNPAFTRLTGPSAAVQDHAYELVARGGLRGTFAYTAILEHRVDMRWEVPGMRETATWTLEPVLGGTRVTHEFTQAGPLAVALRRAMRGVATLRLDRLADVVETATSV
jgi:uncharacterized protein YndB with AHSA1/START domain